MPTSVLSFKHIYFLSTNLVEIARFDVLTAVLQRSRLLWNVTPCCWASSFHVSIDRQAFVFKF